VALPFTFLKKKIFKATEELWKLKYFTMPKKKFQKKNPLKERNQNSSRYYNSVTNLKCQHKPKYNLSKKPHIKKIDLLLLLLPRGPKSLKLLYSIMNPNTKRPTKLPFSSQQPSPPIFLLGLS
jgi:hypothetical protein